MNKLLTVLALTAGIFASNTMASETKYINVCGGGPTGTYHKIAKEFVTELNRGSALKKLGIEARIPMSEDEFGDLGPTYRGSLANLDASLDGECDIFIAQPDAVNYTRAEFPAESKSLEIVAKAGWEYVLPFCKKGEFDDLAQMDDKPGRRVAVVEGSGDYAFMKNLGVVDSDYKDVKLVFPADILDANGEPKYMNDSVGTAEMVADGHADCSLAITSPNSTTVKTIVETVGDKLIFAEASDSDFNDLPYYEFKSIDKDQLVGIERADTFGSQEVIGMERAVVINHDMYSKFNGKETRQVRRAVNNAVKVIDTNW